MSCSSSSPKIDRGMLGEDFVAQWLRQQGWHIVHRRWRCRWGELDIIAMPSLPLGHNSGGKQCPILVFVEVKTRRQGNWDEDGLLAVTESKQAKLWQTAELFLGDRPDLADYSCRFDVALVRCNSTGRVSPPLTVLSVEEQLSGLTIKVGHPVELAGYQLILHDYIPEL